MQYGEVTDVFIPKPFRAFAFVTFADHQVRFFRNALLIVINKITTMTDYLVSFFLRLPRPCVEKT